MSWSHLENANPELVAFGKDRFDRGVAYLATLRKDGSPRVHQVTPIIGEGRLFLFMEPTSPKGHDLRRDGRYALHSQVSDPGGTGGEFVIRGRGRSVEDPATRALAARLSSYTPADRYVLFELDVEAALGTEYDEEDQPVRRRWQKD